MTRIRLQGLTVPFLICSLVLIVPTFIYLTFTSSKAPTNDAFTSVSANQLYEIGDEVSGGVIMPKLPNATAK
jgi:hypothetical protein